MTLRMLEVVKTSKGLCLPGWIRMFSNDSEKTGKENFYKGKFSIRKKK